MRSSSDFRQCLCGLRVISANTANPCLVLHNGAKVVENGAVLWMNLWMKQSPVSFGGKAPESASLCAATVLPLYCHCVAAHKLLVRVDLLLGDGLALPFRPAPSGGRRRKLGAAIFKMFGF